MAHRFDSVRQYNEAGRTRSGLPGRGIGGAGVLEFGDGNVVGSDPAQGKRDDQLLHSRLTAHIGAEEFLDRPRDCITPLRFHKTLQRIALTTASSVARFTSARVREEGSPVMGGAKTRSSVTAAPARMSLALRSRCACDVVM
jgi:hypothetical protein